MGYISTVPLVIGLLFSAASTPVQQDVSYVTFQIAPLPAAGSGTWIATYADPRGTAKFTIALPIDANADQDAKGFVRHVDGSKPQPFLQHLAQALGATKVEHRPAVKKLAFEFVVLGTHERRLPDGGGFTRDPPGEWILVKLFLADEAEVYLNLNPAEGIGELSAKDEAYGNAVLRELASVL